MINLLLDEDILLPHLKFDASLTTKMIPKNLFQTYVSKEKIPSTVFENILKFAPEYNYYFFDDKQCRDFLYHHFIPKVLNKFDELKKGAHKADLFRYCILYIFGGVYLDVKTVLVKPLRDIFVENETDYNSFYSVLSIINRSIYQGILAVRPLSEIMKNSINYILNTSHEEIDRNYIIFTEYLYEDLERMSKGNNNMLKSGNNIFKNKERFYLFREVCCNFITCPLEKKDRYGLSCDIFDSENNLVFKTRFADFPW